MIGRMGDLLAVLFKTGRAIRLAGTMVVDAALPLPFDPTEVLDDARELGVLDFPRT